MEPAFLQTKKIIQKAHENCRPMSAWNEKSQKFVRCTEQLNASISWLGEAFGDIENFVAGHMILTGVLRFFRNWSCSSQHIKVKDYTRHSML